MTSSIPRDVGLVIHGAVDHQEDDVSNFQGGLVDPTIVIMDTNLTVQTEIFLVSSSPTDASQLYLVEGINSENIVITELIQLNGLTSVGTAEEFIKLYKVTKQSGALLTGSVTVFGAGTTFGSLPAAFLSGFDMEVTELRSLLVKANPSPTKSKVFYEKFFIANGTLSVINTLRIEEFTDPKGCAKFVLDPNFNDNTTSTNRLVRPGSIPIEEWFALPRTITGFQPGDSIGVWLKIDVPAGRLTSTKPYVIKLIVDGQTAFITLLQLAASSRTLETINEFRYDHALGGGNPNRFLELVGAKFVTTQFYEPDPNTFRDDFYYNARLNRLFKKINSKPNPVWKIVR